MTLEQLEFLYAKTEETLGENPPAGVVFTPIDKAKELLAPLIAQAKGDILRILEPSSGAGNLIIATLQALESLRVPPRKVQITSVEIDEEYMQVQRQFISRHFKSWESSINFCRADFVFGFEDKEAFDLVIMNPPWVGYKQMAAGLRLRLKSKFSLSGQFDFLDGFVLKTFGMLKPGGRMAMFLPDKVISSHQPSNSIDLIRPLTKRLAVTQLPSTFFFGVQHESVFIKVERSKKSLSLVPTKKDVTEEQTIDQFFSLFRGLELSGRSSGYLTTQKSEALDPKRGFVSGQELAADGSLSIDQQRYVSKRIPTNLIKKHFNYSGPAILVRKTGNPVHVCFVDHLPFVSQVVFVVVPKPGIEVSGTTLTRLAQYLQSADGQAQLKKNSGKLGRSLFPYVTLSDIKNVVIDPRKLGIKVGRKAAA